MGDQEVNLTPFFLTPFFLGVKIVTKKPFIENVIAATRASLEPMQVLVPQVKSDAGLRVKGGKISSAGADDCLMLGMAFSRQHRFGQARAWFAAVEPFCEAFLESSRAMSPMAPAQAHNLMNCALLGGLVPQAESVARAVLEMTNPGPTLTDAEMNWHTEIFAAFLLGNLEDYERRLSAEPSGLGRNEWVNRDLASYRGAWSAILRGDQESYNAAVSQGIVAFEQRRLASDGSRLGGFGGYFEVVIDFIGTATAKIAVLRGLQHDQFADFLPQDLLAET